MPQPRRVTPFTRTLQFRVLLVAIALMPIVIMVLAGSTALMRIYVLVLGVCRILWYTLAGAGLVNSRRL
jgi:hypothetical protein